LSNASTPEGRGPERPNDAEPFFPSEGTFNPVVPLSEIGETPAPLTLPAVDPADVGEPAEAAWAREEHRAGRKEEEETLVPSRAARASRGRPSWLVPAVVIAVSVVAGLASGSYLIWSSQRAREATPPAQVATEAPALPPAPPAEQAEASTKVEEVREPVEDEKPGEVAKAEKSVEPSPTPKPAPSPRPAPRAEQVARAAEARETKPAPKPARTQNAPPSRPRLTAAEKQPPKVASSERTPPISSPPPTAKSKKVIHWP
jgi:cytoskeletal protein RodZ